MRPPERWVVGTLIFGYFIVISVGIAVGYHYG